MEFLNLLAVKLHGAASFKFGNFMKMLNIELLHDPAILVLRIHPEEINHISTPKTCTQMSLAVFTTTKSGNNPMSIS